MEKKAIPEQILYFLEQYERIYVDTFLTVIKWFKKKKLSSTNGGGKESMGDEKIFWKCRNAKLQMLDSGIWWWISEYLCIKTNAPIKYEYFLLLSMMDVIIFTDIQCRKTITKCLRHVWAIDTHTDLWNVSQNQYSLVLDCWTCSPAMFKIMWVLRKLNAILLGTMGLEPP